MIFKRRTAASCAAAVMIACGMLRVTAQQPFDFPPRETAPGEICGTGLDRLRQLGLRATLARTDGQGISFQQDPALLFSDYTGPLVLRDFLVASDVPTMRFKPAYVEQHRNVAARRHASGRRPSGQRVRAVVAGQRDRSHVDRAAMGRDQLGLYWGELLGEGVEPGDGDNLWLRWRQPICHGWTSARSAPTCSTQVTS